MYHCRAIETGEGIAVSFCLCVQRSVVLRAWDGPDGGLASWDGCGRCGVVCHAGHAFGAALHGPCYNRVVCVSFGTPI
jgi:hypothetical protein